MKAVFILCLNKEEPLKLAFWIHSSTSMQIKYLKQGKIPASVKWIFFVLAQIFTAPTNPRFLLK